MLQANRSMSCKLKHCQHRSSQSEALILVYVLSKPAAEDLAQQLARKNNPTAWVITASKRLVRQKLA